MSKVLVVVLVVVSGRTITITITTSITQTLTALRFVRDSDSAVTHLLVSPSTVILGCDAIVLLAGAFRLSGAGHSC